jgi:hypothetical protein
MKALHSIWSAPLFSDKPYYMEDFEILTMVISALTWKKYNGFIKIVADENAMEYLEKTNLISIYDEIEYLIIDEKINPCTFWAAGKIFALKSQIEPYALIDTDFIAWKNIDDFICSDVTAAHEESLKSAVYPEKSYFKMNDKYRFNEGLNWNALPYNTAFLYIKDNLFKSYYIAESINFMRNNTEKENDIKSMVFAEQRLLGVLAESWNISIGTLMNENELSHQNSFTHIWGYKEVLKRNNLKRFEFCNRCLVRIKNDFPEYINVLSEIPQLKEYVEKNESFVSHLL